MIVGFRTCSSRVWEAERPRAVFVGFDFIGTPTYRNELLPDYQAGRDFPPGPHGPARPTARARLERSDFPWAKAPGFEADDFLAAAVTAEEQRGGDFSRPDERPRHVPARERPKTTLLLPRAACASSTGSGLQRCSSATASRPTRCPTSSRCAETRPTVSPAPAASAPSAPRSSSSGVRHARRARSRRARFSDQADDAADVPPDRPPPVSTRDPGSRRRAELCRGREARGGGLAVLAAASTPAASSRHNEDASRRPRSPSDRTGAPRLRGGTHRSEYSSTSSCPLLGDVLGPLSSRACSAVRRRRTFSSWHAFFGLTEKEQRPLAGVVLVPLNPSSAP